MDARTRLPSPFLVPTAQLRWLALLVLAAALSIAAPARAQLPQYGYVVGRLEPEKSFLEQLDPAHMGKYLHYHIFLMTAANEEYQVVIDVNDVSPSVPLIHRLVALKSSDAALFGPVFSATSDFHLISNHQTSFGPLLEPTPAQQQAAGALDYLRHPGILKAIEDAPWQQMYAVTTADPLQWSLPALDALFKPSPGPDPAIGSRVYVFGSPFTSGGKGMHVVHQNQSDITSSFATTNAPWQDGAVIVERTLQFKSRFFVRRTLLMVKFKKQTDFSAESNDVTPGSQGGHTTASNTQTLPYGLICGDYQDFGPFSATQLEVQSLTPANVEPYGPDSHPKYEVHIKNGAFTSLQDPGDVSMVDDAVDPGADARVFARLYSPLMTIYGGWWHWGPHNVRSNFYVRVHAIDPNSYCDSALSASMTVKSY